MTTTTLHIITDDEPTAILSNVDLDGRRLQHRASFMHAVEHEPLAHGWAPLRSALDAWWPVSADRYVGNALLGTALCDPSDPPCPRGSGCDYCTA